MQKFNLIEDIPADFPKIITNRPTIGCRALVRKALQVLNIVLHEMEDWKEDVRLHSTKLLQQIVIHSEDHLAVKYYDINAVLCKTCQDPEPAVAKLALEVAELIGYFVNHKTWSKYAFDELKARQNKLGPIKCLNALFSGSVDKQKYSNLEQLSDIFLDISICHNNVVAFQNELLKILQNLIPGIADGMENATKNFYMTTLKCTAIGYDNEDIRNEGLKVLNMLVEKAKVQNLTELHTKYLKSALDTLDLLDKANDEYFEQLLVLYGIICICGFEVNFLHFQKLTHG